MKETNVTIIDLCLDGFDWILQVSSANQINQLLIWLLLRKNAENCPDTFTWSAFQISWFQVSDEEEMVEGIHGGIEDMKKQMEDLCRELNLPQIDKGHLKQGSIALVCFHKRTSSVPCLCDKNDALF